MRTNILIGIILVLLVWQVTHIIRNFIRKRGERKRKARRKRREYEHKFDCWMRIKIKRELYLQREDANSNDHEFQKLLSIEMSIYRQLLEYKKFWRDRGYERAWCIWSNLEPVS